MMSKSPTRAGVAWPHRVAVAWPHLQATRTCAYRRVHRVHPLKGGEHPLYTRWSFPGQLPAPPLGATGIGRLEPPRTILSEIKI